MSPNKRSKENNRSQVALLLTCEHAGNRVPKEFAKHFKDHQDLLATHRGWDPGALKLAKYLERHLQVPLIFTDYTRLLVEPNRSLGHPNLFSLVTRDLHLETKSKILELYYHPHRQSVTSSIAALVKSGTRVIHLGVHSFTPVLDGEVRQTEFGLLYDPRRNWEKQLVVDQWLPNWQTKLQNPTEMWRMRRNYPYRGISDGFTTSLRKIFADRDYAGIELEVNQALFNSHSIAKIAAPLIDMISS